MDPAQTDDAPDRARPWVALVLSFAIHVSVVGLLAVRGAASDDEPRGDPFAMGEVDVEVAPVAPPAEALPPEENGQAVPVSNDDVALPLAEASPPTPEPPPIPERQDDDGDQAIPRDAGVVIDAPAAPPEEEKVATAPPADAAPPSTGDAGAAEESEGGASVGTIANLLALVPDKHRVAVVIRFDRFRGTEWSEVAQGVLAVMPDYETLVGDPDVMLADELDLVAVSSARPKDANATLLAIKGAMTAPGMRDFLDEDGAHVAWSRVTGGVMGTRARGARVRRGDKRVFLAPYGKWMVLARPKDLTGLLDPVEGELDDAAGDQALMPAWLAGLDRLEEASGDREGPAVLMTLAPRSRTWQVPDVGLGVDSLPAPERFTLSLEIDPSGFVVRGHLKFRDEAEAQQFVVQARAARDSALENPLIKKALEKLNAYKAVKNLGLRRTDRRVSYSTSMSIADARVLLAAGTLLLGEYFDELEDADDEP